MPEEDTSRISPTWVDQIKANRPILVHDRTDIPTTTFPRVIRDHAETYPETIQYVTADDREYTLGKFYDISTALAKSLIALGLDPFDVIAIHGFNSVEWFTADVGANLAACVPTGIYTTNKAQIVAYILQHANVRVLFVDDDESAMRKILSIRKECPSLFKIVMWGHAYDPKSTFPEHAEHIQAWDEFLKVGEHLSDDEVANRIELPTAESTCKLIYTSGTTGPPKAVMMSHDNVVFTANMLGQVFRDNPIKDRLVSYLPCSHIAANLSDIFGPIINRATVYIADAGALKGTLVKTLRKARPTVFVAVPRVFEKIQEKMLEGSANSWMPKRMLATFAKDIGRRVSECRDRGETVTYPWGYTLADFVVFQNVRKALGLDAAKLIVNTSAPMQKATDLYFKQFDFQICDLYGSSEATGPFTLNYPDYRLGTSGKPFPGIEAKLVKKISDEEGELCFRGRNMFMGYLNNAEESARTMDNEGFVHTGDLGKIDKDGFITITGRVKELLITAGGENVAPVLVESTLMSAMPAICRAFAVGDSLKFISALVTPFMDADGNLIGPAADVNPNVKTVEEAIEDDVWKKYLNEGVAKANEEAISSAAKVKKFRMMTKDFSVERDELTPSLKVKRKNVVVKYADVIASMYE